MSITGLPLHTLQSRQPVSPRSATAGAKGASTYRPAMIGYRPVALHNCVCTLACFCFCSTSTG